MMCWACVCDLSEQSWDFEGRVVNDVLGLCVCDLAEQSWAFEGRVVNAVLGLCVT